jgi:DNA-directed RNA polymerase subunit RPC12/RpoP
VATQLRVIKDDEGRPTIRCPRCNEKVQPTYYEIFDAYDCPECGQSIDVAEISRFLKALAEYEDGMGI